MSFIRGTLAYNLYVIEYEQQVPFSHNIDHPTSYLDTVNIGNIRSPISQVPILFGIYHLLGFIRDTLAYNLYVVGYVQQVRFSHNIDHPTSYLDTVNIGNIRSPISQVPKLFGIYHLLGFIRGTLDYNLYIVGYVQQVPFSHNIDHPNTFPDILIHFLLKFSNFQKNYPITRAAVLLVNVWRTILKEWYMYSIL